MTVFAILIGKKTSCLLPRKELRQIEPKMRCFCISTTEIRERLWFKMRMELRQTTHGLLVWGEDRCREERIERVRLAIDPLWQQARFDRRYVLGRDVGA